MRVLVTGAGGFVGGALVARLAATGHAVVACARTLPARPVPAARWIATGDLEHGRDWGAVLDGIEAVVHLAARVHRPGDRDEAACVRANVDVATALARAAAGAGVRAFVFASTVKVHGERSPVRTDGSPRPFTEADPPAPQDPYARSKWQAEQALAAIAADTGLAVTVLRPPLVYGPGVRANFLALLRAVDRGWPLPFGAVDNRRSLVYLGNLVDALARCVEDARAAGRTFLVCDGEDVSTAQLARRLGEALGRPARLLPVPPGLLLLGARLAGRTDAAQRLLGSLCVDAGALRARLDWRPPVDLATGLAETVRAYRADTMSRQPC